MKVLYLVFRTKRKAYWRQVGWGSVNNDGSIKLLINLPPEVGLELREQEFEPPQEE
jgi:hypothetical protein